MNKLHPRLAVIAVTLFCIIVAVVAIAFSQQFTLTFPKAQDDKLASSTSSLSAIALQRDEIYFVHNLVHKGEDIGQIAVKYTDSKDVVFSDLYVVKNIDGKNIILYKTTRDGFFRLDGEDFQFDLNKLGGFGGYQLVFLGNDFFVVQELSADHKSYSSLVAIYWDDKNKQYQSTFAIPKKVLKIINGNSDGSGNQNRAQSYL
jgi:hypothetical protein